VLLPMRFFFAGPVALSAAPCYYLGWRQMAGAPRRKQGLSSMTLKINGIIWLASVIEKISIKHGVSCEEVCQVLQRRATFRSVEKGHRRGENVYAALGRTEAGRYLVVFFIHKPDHRILILTARDMTVAERRRYEKK